MSDSIEYLHDQLMARQACARDAGRAWVYQPTPDNLRRLDDAADDAMTAWYWYHRALKEAEYEKKMA